MKTYLLLLVAASLSSFAVSLAEVEPQYKVSITNLTKGQMMHHPFLILHSEKFSLFKMGEKVGEGLALLATEGDHSVLKKNLREKKSSVEKYMEAETILYPGKTVDMEFYTSSKYLSLASMLATTNDGFVAGRKIKLKINLGDTETYFLNVYDAGAEANNESCDYIPGPPCNSHNKYSESSEGFVHKHPGLFGLSDVSVQKYAFNGNQAAKIVISRVK